MSVSGHFPKRLRFLDTRRGFVQAAGAGLLALATGRLASANAPAVAGARLAADFDATAAVWLGYDAGHQELTARLAEALAPFVRIKMLVRDAAAQADAWALLQRRGLRAGQIQFVLDARAPFFVRDAAVFGLDGDNKAFIVDFKWTYYGWGQWCRRTLQGSSHRASECDRPDEAGVGELDRWLADQQGWASFQSGLVMEGGGVEANGRGLLIANSALWRARNPRLTPAALELEIKRLPGVRKIIWLPNGLAHDPLHRSTIVGPYVGWGTGGHTDEFVRFADPRTVLLAWADEAEARSHPVARLNQARMRANYDVLVASKDQDGKPLRVLKVPLPKTIERPVVLAADADISHSEQWSAASFPAREGRHNGDTVRQVAISSYMNYVVANKLVLLPDYVPHGTSPARQDQVRHIFEAAFPGRKVQFIDTGHTNWFGGGMHCATLNEPLARG
jgi:agmatine deiminase